MPRYAGDSKVLFVADKSNKVLQIDKDSLNKLNVSKLHYDELPDIIAYSKKKNWLYLIEVVHSSGPMSEERVFELKKMLKDCKAELIFVTAFTFRNDLRKWILDIAWETEVWAADNPEHTVHFNGNKFFGPYN